MTDIIDRLKEPEAHYPGNFDTPKRANAMLSCLCQEAAEEIESLRRELENERARDIHSCGPDCTRSGCVNRRLREELAASQAREQQLLVALVRQPKELICGEFAKHTEAALKAIALPTDTTALSAMIAKAGEVMLERCAVECERHYNFSNALAAAIRALPAVTIDDLK